MSDTILIETSKLFSHAECEEIVRKTLHQNDVAIRSVEVFGNKSVFGFLGEYFRLVIRVDQPNPLVYFVKSLPLENEQKRKHIETFQMFSRESCMYREFLPTFKRENDNNQWHANCYLAREDVLVLEDLTELGYSHLKYRSRFNTAMIRCCLKNVAKLHADSIAYVENVLCDEKFEDKFADLLVETSITDDNTWFLCGLRAIKGCAPLAKNFYKHKEEWSDEEFDRRIRKTYEIVKPSKIFRNVICHQDLWANNIMFKFEKQSNSNNPDLDKPINCVFMDFQFYKYTPPALDVLQLLLMTTRLDYRRKHYEDHFKYYHSCLADELKSRGFDVNEVLPWQEFRLSCDELRLFPVIYNCVAQPLVYLEPEKQLKMNSDPAKHQHILLVDRTAYIREAMADDEQFKEVVMENVEELLDYLFGEDRSRYI